MITCTECGKPLVIKRIQTSVIQEADWFEVTDKGDGLFHFKLYDHRTLDSEVEHQEYACNECGSGEGITEEILEALFDCGE